MTKQFSVPVLLPADPASALHAATKQYVDAAFNRRCGCLLTHSASIGTGVASTIAWATEAEDTDGFHAANSTDIIVPTGLGGYYAITIQTDAGGTLNGASNVQITVGSVTYPNYISASNRYGALSITVSCPAATVIRGIVYNGHSGAATFTSRFSVQRVST